MKRAFLSLFAAGFFFGSLNLAAQSPSIGGFNVYYGSLHNHCNISDGTGTADDAYNYARNTGKLDFFSLADHSGAIDATEWTAMKTAADKYNQDNVFTAFRGFEWTENVRGHVAVINSDNYITTASPNSTFPDLCNWLNANECVAFFNHPGRNNSTGVEFDHFATTPTSKIVGMELWNKTDRFNVYYYTDGYYPSDGNLSWFDEALARGWKIGAAGSEDNHAATWGTMTQSKLAVLATANTRTTIMDALKARRFFTTYDKNLALSFKIGGSEMGSTITGANYGFQIQASDANMEVFTQIQLLRNGQVVNTWTPNTANPVISLNQNCFDGEYYYVRVKQADGDEAISSPIQVSGGMTNEPPIVAIASPLAGDVYTTPASITINATASDPGGNVVRVDFYQGTTLLGTDTGSPYTCTWSNAPRGTYVLTAKATDDSGTYTISPAVTVIVINPGDPVVRSVGIATAMDDIEEGFDGIMYPASTDMELGYDGGTAAKAQTTGFRFANLLVPKDAIITGAYIQFTCDEVNSAACSLTIMGEAADHSLPFTATPYNLSNRNRTSSFVSWAPVSWPTAGAAGTDQRTPALTSIIQEIVNRPGYSVSSAVSILINGTGTRTAKAYEGAPASVARLVVEYSLTPVNLPPVVSLTSPANGATFVESDPVILAASASDPDGSVTKVDFYQGTTLLVSDGTSPYSCTLSAGLSAGTYAFTAKATDNSGASTTSQVITITVTPSTTSGTITKRIIAGSDDAEEYASGTMSLTTTALEMAYGTKSTGNQITGLRFTGISVPAGATITGATIQFGASKKTSGTCSLTILGEKAGSSAAFTTSKNNISGRARTGSTVSWIPASWTTIGATGIAQLTPDISVVIQEIISSPGWVTGNPITLFISGTGTRTAYAFEGSSAKAALLTIRYELYGPKVGIIAENQNPEQPLNHEIIPENRMICYPVPFNDRIQVDLSVLDNETPESISLLNASGIVVKKLTANNLQYTLNTGDLPRGIYLIIFKTNLTVYRKTIVKI
jgi:hypothetical protein